MSKELYLNFLNLKKLEKIKIFNCLDVMGFYNFRLKFSHIILNV